MYSGDITSQTKLYPAVSSAWPAIVIATVLLAPFLNTPFTIDDPLYLREAQHALTDPLHPQAFDVVWVSDQIERASVILPGGLFVPYLLMPVILAGGHEWTAHVLTLLLLFAALVSAAMTALRLGLDLKQARLVTILIATCPAVLGMANTVMPDVAAMALVILGMERILAWREDWKWPQAILATLWLTLAALTRMHTIFALAPAAIFLLDGIKPAGIRSSLKRFPGRFTPIILTPIAFFVISAVLSDPKSNNENILFDLFDQPIRMDLLFQNTSAFLAHWVLVIPFTIPWLMLRFRQMTPAVALVPLVCAMALFFRHGRIAFVVGLTLVVLADIGWDAIKRRDQIQLALLLWLFLAIPVIFYIHLPSKYLLPSVPAAIILLVRMIPESPPRIARWLIPSIAAAGATLGLLILLGIRDLAETQRRAVAELVDPHIKLGERVRFSGNWGFQWYAEHAGASPATIDPPPRSGDIVVISEIDRPFFVRANPPPHIVIQQLAYTSSGPGRVMDWDARAGFFSSQFGYLPWRPGTAEASRFEVWEIE